MLTYKRKGASSYCSIEYCMAGFNFSVILTTFLISGILYTGIRTHNMNNLHDQPSDDE